MDEVATTIADKSSVAVRLGKRAVYEQAGMSLADAYACTSRVIVKKMLATDAREGISGFLNKRQPTRQG